MSMADDPCLASKNTKAILTIITNHLRSFYTCVVEHILKTRILESMC